MRKFQTLLLLSFSLLLILSGCLPDDTASDSNSHSKDEDIQIITSIFPMYEITKQIAGEQADVSLMVGPSEDAHHYEPSAQTIAAVNEADIFVYSSDEMEFWAESILAVVENDDLKVIELGKDLDFSLGLPAHEPASDEEDNDSDHAHDHGSLDPHFWLNPVAVESQLPLLVDALTTVDAAGRDIYEKNAMDFSKQLLELDQSYQEAFADATTRSFVVQHQAFGHLAAQYNLNQVAVGGLTTEVEPDPKQLAEIVDFVKAQEVPVVYYQSGENSAIAETVAKETGTDIAVLYDLESAPANVGEENNLYIKMMYENLEQLKKSIH